MPEFVSYADRDEIITINKKIVTDRNESFDVDKKKLNDIVDSVNSGFDPPIFNDRNRIIKRAAIIMARITWGQPFNEGNRETALYFTIQYLYKNKLDLQTTNPKIQREIYILMEKTIDKFENDETIITEIELYLKQIVIDLKFTDW